MVFIFKMPWHFVGSFSFKSWLNFQKEMIMITFKVSFYKGAWCCPAKKGHLVPAQHTQFICKWGHRSPGTLSDMTKDTKLVSGRAQTTTLPWRLSHSYLSFTPGTVISYVYLKVQLYKMLLVFHAKAANASNFLHALLFWDNIFLL